MANKESGVWSGFSIGEEWCKRHLSSFRTFNYSNHKETSLVLSEKIKPGDDAGMPGIEENDPAKGEDTLTG